MVEQYTFRSTLYENSLFCFIPQCLHLYLHYKIRVQLKVTMWLCRVLYLECLPQWCLGWHPMVSVTVVTCWSLQALTEVKLVNTNVKPATSVAMQQGQQAFMCSSSCPVHVSLLAYLYSYRFIVSYQVNKCALQIILFAMFFTTDNFSSL